MPVTWSQIVAECDGYRAGFVSVFRKYEGLKVEGEKVTAPAFARHNGINERTFSRWVRKSDAASVPEPPRNRTVEAIRRDPVAALADLTPEEVEVVRAALPEPMPVKAQSSSVRWRMAATSAAARLKEAASLECEPFPWREAIIGDVEQNYSDFIQSLDTAQPLLRSVR